jgi:hypothetical protein
LLRDLYTCQTQLFIETAREVGADEEKSAADDLMGAAGKDAV